MPLLNGLEAASVIKRNVPHAKLFLFTLAVEGIGALRSWGVDLVVTKEEGLEKLAEYLTTIAAKNGKQQQRKTLRGTLWRFQRASGLSLILRARGFADGFARSGPLSVGACAVACSSVGHVHAFEELHGQVQVEAAGAERTAGPTSVRVRNSALDVTGLHQGG